MSTEPIGGAAPPIKFTGLGSGLKTEEIIQALMAAEREPMVRASEEQLLQQDQTHALQKIQSSLQQLVFSASEMGSLTLFSSSQTVSSSEPTRVEASLTAGAGAGTGGYEVSVSRLASSAQRTFAFASPESEDTVTIEGHEVKVAAGASIEALVKAINSDGEATVYAAALNSETVVLSNRETGSTGSTFIAVSDPGGTLTEVEGTAREGRNAEYAIDGVAGSSASNTLTEAIAGLTLTLKAATGAEPVTVDVAAPEVATGQIEAQVEAFVAQYNSTLEAIQGEVSTKPPAGLAARVQAGTGTLFGDIELSGLLTSMRQSIYAPVSGLPAEMSSLESIGVSTGAPSGSSPYSQSAVEGKLTIDKSTLSEAIKANPAGVEKMLRGWAARFQEAVGPSSEPGGTIASRISGEESQRTYLGQQITTMNEMLAVRQRALESQFSALEAVLARNSSQSNWLAGQLAALPAG